MSKTPKQLAEEYAKDWHKDCDYPEAILRHTRKATETAFLAGYEAAQHKDKAVNKTHLAWKLAEDYGAVKWLTHKDSKRFGGQERGYEFTIARDGFYQGYLAAKEKGK